MKDGAFILTLSCPDRVGIVAGVTGILASCQALITEAHHFREPLSNSSVLRIVFEADGAALLRKPVIEKHISDIAFEFAMTWQIYEAANRPKVLIAVSQQGHCLNSLLHRWQDGTLPVDIAAVVSNHETQRSLVQWHGLPFHYLPITPGDRQRQEIQILNLFADLGADLLVLARYMQILSPQACELLTKRAINIHHSFLPGFKGAKPYHQAYERGVKIIGATAHYVTGDLDEGPIIEQAVERVDHAQNAAQLTSLGHDIESVVLNRAIQWHAERRIFCFGNRTVILR
jgi:formyltetrahydrofolate deformylase